MTDDMFSWKQLHPKKFQHAQKLCFNIFIMYSMQRPKLAQQTSVDQVKFFFGISINMSKMKLFEGLKLDTLGIF